MDAQNMQNTHLSEDTKPKTHMEFGYTMKALKSKKKLG